MASNPSIIGSETIRVLLKLGVTGFIEKDRLIYAMAYLSNCRS